LGKRGDDVLSSPGAYNNRAKRLQQRHYTLRWRNLKWPQVEEFGWPPGCRDQRQLLCAKPKFVATDWETAMVRIYCLVLGESQCELKAVFCVRPGRTFNHSQIGKNQTPRYLTGKTSLLVTAGRSSP